MMRSVNVVDDGAGAPGEAEPQTYVREIQARQMTAEGPKRPAVVDHSAGAPDEGRRPEEAEPQTDVSEIQARQMTAKGPKRPSRKLMSIRFKQDR